MAGDLTVTVHDQGGNAVADVLVRVYDAATMAPVGESRSGTPTFSALPAGKYIVHADPTVAGISSTSPPPANYAPQFYGGGDWYTALQVTIAAANVSITFTLQPSRDGMPVKRETVTFWKDTSDSDRILALYPGEQRRVMDPLDDLYKHVLAGPFLTSSAASSS